MVLEEGDNVGQLTLRNTGAWENGTVVREASLEGKLVVKDDYVWLLNRGGSESIAQYDPSDFTQPKAEYVWEGPSSLIPVMLPSAKGRFSSHNIMVLESWCLMKIPLRYLVKLTLMRMPMTMGLLKPLLWFAKSHFVCVLASLQSKRRPECHNTATDRLTVGDV